MPAEYEASLLYSYPFATLSSSIFRKYPNPFASHVISSDTIDRWVDEEGRLHSIRIHLKRGLIPKWGRALISRAEAFIVEWSVVAVSEISPTSLPVTSDPGHVRCATNTTSNAKRSLTYEMRVITQNLTHKKIMDVRETQRVRPDDMDPSTTRVFTSAVITSNILWKPMARRIESFGLERFKKNIRRSAQGLEFVMAHMDFSKELPSGQSDGLSSGESIYRLLKSRPFLLV